MTLEEQIQLFPPELRTASVVNRWSIVWTLKQDNIAQHSFYVLLYARAIAQLIEWEGSSALLMYMAATHDLGEIFTGDIVGPVKNKIIDPEREAEYTSNKMKERMPGVARQTGWYMNSDENTTDRVADALVIIKAADRLDALLFLIGEKRMGNGVVDELIRTSENRLHEAWQELPCREQQRELTWECCMVPVIRAHTNTGGWGV